MRVTNRTIMLILVFDVNVQPSGNIMFIIEAYLLQAKYSVKELQDINRETKKEAKAKKYQRSKKQKNIVKHVSTEHRPSGEIDKIINTMNEIRHKSIWDCMWMMADNIKEEVYIFRQMKPYFKNQNQVEQDIQDYIEATFEHYDEQYDYSMKEIVWTTNFLLYNTNICINEEVENLKKHLSEMENAGAYAQNLYCLYFNHLLRQLPEEVSVVPDGVLVDDGQSVRDYFEHMYGDEIPEKFNQRIEVLSIRDYFDDMYSDERWETLKVEDLPEDWLFPFKDPYLLKEDKFEDDFTIFLKKLCISCGQKFKNPTELLQHLRSKSVHCGKSGNEALLKALRQNLKPSKSKILQRKNILEYFHSSETESEKFSDSDNSVAGLKFFSDSEYSSADELVLQMKNSSRNQRFCCRGCLQYFKNQSILKHLKSPKLKGASKFNDFNTLLLLSFQ